MTQPKRRVPRPPAKSRPNSPRTAKPKSKAAPKTSKLGSKLDRMISALRMPKGASVMDLMALTGWQMHSVRGAIAGALKKKRGLAVSSKKVGETRIYRIEGKA